MRKRCGELSKLGWLALATSLLGSLGAPEEARATPMVELLFVERNGQAIAPVAAVLAAAGDTLTMKVRLTTDVPLNAVSFSLHFDGEISVVDKTLWAGIADVFVPQFALSEGPGTLSSFNGFGLDGGVLGVGIYDMGTVTWLVGTPVADGNDVDSGPFALTDLFLAANQGVVTPGFGKASVAPAPVPEPGTGSLLGLGLASLAFAAHGRRRAARRREVAAH